MKLSRICTPTVLLLAPVILSALAWSIPGASLFLRGFTAKADLHFGGVIVLACWYLLCALALRLGMDFGKLKGPNPTTSALYRSVHFERRFYIFLSLLAAVGVAYSLYLAQSAGSIFSSLQNQSGNELSQALGGVGGVATLRYTTAIAAPIGIHLWRTGRASFLSASWNIALLMVNALFTSRLSLIMAFVVYILLLSIQDPERRIKYRSLILAGVLGFSLLGILNFFRNANYYLSVGVHDPISMNFYQILSYLGAPFQVSIQVAQAIFDGRYPSVGDPISSLRLLLPTFFQNKSGIDYVTPDHFDHQVDVAGNLTTNSVFGDVYATFGSWGLAYALLTLFFSGVVYSQLSRYGPLLAASAGVVLYAIAEYWRIYLFNQGIVVYLLVAIFVASRVALGSRGLPPTKVTTERMSHVPLSRTRDGGSSTGNTNS